MFAQYKIKLIRRIDVHFMTLIHGLLKQIEFWQSVLNVLVSGSLELLLASNFCIRGHAADESAMC